MQRSDAQANRHDHLPRWRTIIGCGTALLVVLAIFACGFTYIMNVPPPADVLMPGIIIFFIVIPASVAILGFLWKLLPAIIRFITRRL